MPTSVWRPRTERLEGTLFPHPGIQIWENEKAKTIFRLHYSADPSRLDWVEMNKRKMDKASFEQEFEVSFDAKSGSLLYLMDEEATLEQSFPIPQEWTRYWALDPHPRVPHAFLWGAVDPWGDLWIYRELWPSKVCMAYQNGKLTGDKGNVPEDDNRIRIKDYVETVKWLESPANNLRCHDGRAESACLTQPERFYKRVLDYAARGFKDGAESDDQRTLQQKYEDISTDLGYPLSFDDAIKDIDTGIETVNDWLKPREVEGEGGVFIKKSRLHIFQDKCPELIHQIKNNRYEPLTPVMAERTDPMGKPRKKRNHLTDCLRYLCMAKPEFIGRSRQTRSSWKPMYRGVAY